VLRGGVQASYGLFALRDGLTIASSFVLKNMACEK
jgi:hypothetical protein